MSQKKRSARNWPCLLMGQIWWFSMTSFWWVTSAFSDRPKYQSVYIPWYSHIFPSNCRLHSHVFLVSTIPSGNQNVAGKSISSSAIVQSPRKKQPRAGFSWIFMDFLWGLDDTRGFSPWISHKFLPCWLRSKEGWPETLDFIRKVWTEEGPFDGMLGFSQGPFETLGFFGSGGCYMAMDQYLLIPINTIFRGMNIHLPAILMWTTGVQGFDTLPYPMFIES